MSWDYDEDLGFIFDKSDCYDELEPEYECPECGSHNVKVREQKINEDADGNRGIWVESLTCFDCGYDEY